MEEENSSRIISRVVYPIVNLGMSGELIFSEIWMAITVPIKMEMIMTIQSESTPNLYYFFYQLLEEHAPPVWNGDAFRHQHDIFTYLM